MTHILTIETQNESQFTQIKGFAERLGVHVKETHTETSLSEAEELALLERVAGSWVGDETGDELNAIIRMLATTARATSNYEPLPTRY